MDYKLYNGSVTLSFDEKKHVYRVGGERVISVTGVAAPKPALVNWAAGVAADHVRNNLKPGVALDEIEIEELCNAAKWAHRAASSRAANIGTLAHAACEQFAKGERIDPVNKQAKACLDQFVQWWADHKVHLHASEAKVFHADYRYAGTLDLDCEVDGKRCIVDIKTSNAIYDDYWLQVAAYAQARERELGVAYEGGWILRLPKDGGELEFKPRESSEMCDDFEAFLGLLTYYRWAA